MAKRIKFIDGDEYDAFTKFRYCFIWKAGRRKSIKQKYNRRERRLNRRNLRRELQHGEETTAHRR